MKKDLMITNPLCNRDMSFRQAMELNLMSLSDYSKTVFCTVGMQPPPTGGHSDR